MSKDSPFKESKIPVLDSVVELEKFIVRFPDFKFCLYLAFKNEADWEKSTSRVYMNQTLPRFLYIPVNIVKEDYRSLSQLYAYVNEKPQIVAINQTQPHKSNPVLMDLFKDLPGLPTNVDALVKDKSGNLLPYDLNGPSFVGWFNDEIGTFTAKTVVLVGIGGVGEPIARRLIQDKPKKLILVDPVDKQLLAQEIARVGSVEYVSNLNQLAITQDDELILLNAAGKEGVGDDSGVISLLQSKKGTQAIFVDLRPQLDIDIVKLAQELGWQAYTGFGMNARNDYALIEKIAALIGEAPPIFDKFQVLVENAS
ncbi:MAG: Shikimate dehydrogenase [Candidatus Berkelbacteria bacterium Gr01-1014_85]|uniref:Shikimate dehydrogenase n=1 Tax=Candidatus Berkelbacteria bacterium Gr01-1014_85 TaxID=2017150 RepID=A0A554JBL4_9BACT|nr:MAG: Shikimate dehydrogenase [Candidatus Berkelbacteria bacterium Gr01-1014_85]